MREFKTIEEWLDYNLTIKHIISFYTTAITNSVPNVTLKDVYLKCEEYRKQGKLAVAYELRCPECAEIIGIYDSIINTSENNTCPKCGSEDIDIFYNSIVLYKFIRKDK